MQKKMLKISFLASISGILILFILINLLQAKSITSYEDLRLGEYVKVGGKIISVKSYSDFSVVKLDSNITITCNCKLKINDSIEVIGKIEEYDNIKQINAEKISLIKTYKNG